MDLNFGLSFRTRVPAVLVACATMSLAGNEPSLVSFNRDIRPILSENCFRCHGPDQGERQGGIRFDQEGSAKGVGESGHAAIVPGKSAESELFVRIVSTDADILMPPPDSGKALTAAQVDLLKRWIDEGGVWEGHWSLLPIKGTNAGEISSPIDHFIKAGLGRVGLEPMPRADGVTLARRLSFDLIGLPPSIESVEALTSGDMKAYERQVEAHLESPHFGERLAMIWLDLVRYADSVGYHGDQPLSISPYRDYVINSFNANKRFDRFTIEQIAGDLLAHATSEQLIASGYNRLGMMSAEGGIQDKEYRAKYAAERVRNLSGAWLGMTLGCCECHDHKYDPFTTREFYSMAAFFADIDEFGFYASAYPKGDWGPSMGVPTLEQQVELARLDASIKSLDAKLQTSTPELGVEQAAWERDVAGTAEWVVIKPITVASASGATLEVKDDLSILVKGNSPDQETYTVTARLPISAVTAIRIEAIPDDSLPQRGPGRAENGNFVLTELSVIYRADPQGKAQPISLDNATATHEQTTLADSNPYKSWNVTSAIDGDAKGPTWGWAILPEVGVPQHAVFETVLDIHPSAEGVTTFTLAQNLDNPRHTLGRFRISVTSSPRPVRASGNGLPAPLRTILSIAPEQRTPEQKALIASYFLSVTPSLAGARQTKADLESERNKLMSQVRTTLVTRSVTPRTIRVLSRGNWMDETGEIVLPAIPAVLPQPAMDGRRLNRLDLATWLVDGKNPLTARVFVNRLWKIYFGQGLSRKLDDLGSQGDWPSHPELLDWLADEFVRSGWNVKHIIKQIVMSQAYQRSSIPTAQGAEADPYNRWLARQGRYRLDAELVRDNALATSGLLRTTIGGPSVFPYQPPGYWSYLNFPEREWKNGSGDDLYRRGIYTHWQRQYLHPSLLAFDAPSREECTAERVRSSTPIQSLVLLNDTTYVEAARTLAERILSHKNWSDAQRLDELFRVGLSRPIREQESKVLLALIAKHRAEFASEPASAKGVADIGSAAAHPTVSDVERAAWTSAVRAVFNLHAFVTRY